MGNLRVAIIGGGISGLAAAERLVGNAALQDSVEVHLFEAGDRLGGVMQTEVADGFCLEQGPDSILSRIPAAIELCRRLGFDHELVCTNPSPGGAHVVCRGRLHRIPEGLAIMAPSRVWPIVATPILSWRAKLRLAADLFIPRRQDATDETLADFIRRRLGRETLDRLVQPLAGGIYMGSPEELSAHATFPQFVEMERQHGSLIRAARKSTPRKKTRSARSSTGGPSYSLFVAPRRGMSQLVNAVADKLDDCRIYCRHRVERLEPGEGHGWRIAVFDEAAGRRNVQHFDGVVLALPATHAGAVLRTACTSLADLLSSIPYSGCTVVNLAFDATALPRSLSSFGFVTPHVERRPTLACTFTHLKYPDRAPAGKILLRAFLGGACFPSVMEWSDDEVLAAVRQDLAELIDITAPPVSTHIKRWRQAMPQYTLGHLERVRKIEELAAKLPALELAGNYFRGVGIPHCIHSGEQASQRLLAALRQEHMAYASTRARPSVKAN